ncbi:MAG: pyrroloquinoline quinone biosynthesis protein PqqB [Gammaproteobacteria bacterium]|nr:pyrroloquinoline quinone biosynthesis protein PqqB [Gammaproteobacteria bacterium]
MHVHVLGSAAGGGFPQWNCNCDNCARLRSGELNARPRSQSSIAISANQRDWLLINASPDIRDQIAQFAPLQPSEGKRGTGIRAVLLCDSQIDHTTGLLILREGERLELYCSDMVYEDLTTGFPVLKMLDHYCGVNRHPIPIDGSSFKVDGLEDLRLTTLSLSSKAPPYSPHREDPHPGDNVGLLVEDEITGHKLFYAPGLGEIEPHVLDAMKKADCLLVDGTFWTDDEMMRRGVGKKRAIDMGHLAQSGPGGMLEVLNTLTQARKVLIHINNTNPILDEDSPERATLTAAGVEVSWDGMDIEI